ncbi:MAG: SoxR reducing system RseC family protein [Thiotrichaceae bacterium]|nr:SoxR reducing system RseC family protein [Thiotrichaceae bacterium]
MIEETAIVTQVRQNYAEIVPDSNESSCSNCQSGASCGSLKEFFSFLSPKAKPQSALRVSNPIYAKTGDHVVIGVKPDALLAGSVLVYLIPLVFLLVGALLGDLIFTSLSLNAELGSILVGLFSFTLSLFIIREILKLPSLEKRLEAVIIRVVPVDSLAH